MNFCGVSCKNNFNPYPPPQPQVPALILVQQTFQRDQNDLNQDTRQNSDATHLVLALLGGAGIESFRVGGFGNVVPGTRWMWSNDRSTEPSVIGPLSSSAENENADSVSVLRLHASLKNELNVEAVTISVMCAHNQSQLPCYEILQGINA